MIVEGSYREVMSEPEDASPSGTSDHSDVVDVLADVAVYGYASVDLYRILHNFALDPTSAEFKAPLGDFHHSRALADPNDRTIVAMNVDTPYSYAWLDLRAEPTVLTVPATAPDRYVSTMLVDLYTYIVGYISPRTHGHIGGRFLLAGPSWSGVTPHDVDGVFRCPTDLMLVFVRTQLFDASDMPAVAEVQDGFALHPLSALTGTTPPDPAPALAPVAPVDVRAGLDPRFFDVLCWMLELMPELPEDADLRARVAGIGVVPGATPSGHVDQTLLTAGLGAGLGRMGERARTITSSGEIFGSREFFAGDHLSRACGAMLGILGNSADEYLSVGYRADADGAAFDGTHDYTITFAPGGLPPVDAFWSITAYDADSFLFANPLDRYTVGSRDLDRLMIDDDGSITLRLSSSAPSGGTANWLPVPATPFTLAFRTYLPRGEIRSGTWTAPPVVRVH